MLRLLKRVILPLFAVLLLVQVFRPARTNPPVDPRREIHANLPVDPAVNDVFARSCNDCHSNRTVWPWYSGVAPASWLIVSDVKRGRKALNLSEWGTYKVGAQQKHLAEVCKEVSEGEMPVLHYKLMHPDAKLTKADVVLVCEWARSNQQSSAAVEAEVQE
jgi:hypothetical protein